MTRRSKRDLEKKIKELDRDDSSKVGNEAYCSWEDGDDHEPDDDRDVIVVDFTEVDT